MNGRWSKPELLVLAARGLGRVDHHGLRGATMVTSDEITAMAGLLAVLGLSGIKPGEDAPDHPETLMEYRFEGELK